MFSHRENNTQRIAATDERAEALRLRPGMGIADARAMHPSIEVIEADPQADRRLLESLADWCDRYTPLVAVEGTEGLFLDITGCAHLFGGEHAMLDDLSSRLFHQGFDVRVGLASTPGAAWAGARHCLPPVAPGGEEEALATLPLAALRLPAETRTGLESVGLRTVAVVLGAPRAALARRFGKGLLLRLDQALGHVEEAISPRLHVAALSVERHLAEPITELQHIEDMAALLAASLKKDLERRGEGGRLLELALFRVDGDVRRISVGTSRPLREPRLVMRLFRERLAKLAGSLDAGYGFDLVRLSAVSTAAMTAIQADLGKDEDEASEDIGIFADRVRARLGEQAIVSPLLVESHIPERAVAGVPFTGAMPGRVTGIGRERPIRLFRHPEPVDVPVTEVPEGPPLNFRWRRAMHRVARAEGPERIAPEWWRGGESASRDYFRIEDTEGRRFWLYREGEHGGEVAPRWFMQGLSA